MKKKKSLVANLYEIRFLCIYYVSNAYIGFYKQHFVYVYIASLMLLPELMHLGVFGKKMESWIDKRTFKSDRHVNG